MKYPYPGIIAPSAILLPIGVMIARFKALSAELKTLFYFLLVSVVIYVLSTVLASNHLHNTWVIHLDTMIESLFLLRFYYLIIRRPSARRWIGYAAVLLPLFCVANMLFLQGAARHNSYSRPVEALIFIALSMSYWWHADSGEATLVWTATPANWIVSGLLLYFAGSLFLFVFSNFLASRYSIAVNLMVWNIHATLVIIMYVLFAIGCIQRKA